MQKFMKKHKLLTSSVQFFYDIILSSLTLLFSTDFSTLPMNKIYQPHHTTPLPGSAATIILLLQKLLLAHELFGYKR